jgi:peptidyl-prolyl cis-trans isomerase C
MEQLQEGTLKFTDAARQFSTCPSSSQGGSLGSFPPGRMVSEFDAVIFDPETPLGVVVGPIQTKVRRDSVCCYESVPIAG